MVVQIVVGVDGSAAAGSALEWALEQARLWSADVHVVDAWSGGLVPLFPPAGRAALLLEAQANAVADHVIGEARARAEVVLAGPPAVRVTQSAAQGTAGLVLHAVAREAQLLVLGEHQRGSGPRPSRSGTRGLLRRPPCAVAVVRGGWTRTDRGRVLLRHGAGADALQWAEVEAAVRAWPLLLQDAAGRPVARAGDLFVAGPRPGALRRLLGADRALDDDWSRVLVRVGRSTHPCALRPSD